MTKQEQVHDLINTLRDRTHVEEFADMCAKRAESYAAPATYAADYAARYASAAAYARYASDAAAAATAAPYAAATDADYAATYAAYAAADSDCTTYYKERDLQIAHLNELHSREESSDL